MMKKRKITQELIWINSFARDFLICCIIAYLHYATNFNSKTVFLITGMMFVYVTWKLNDYWNHKKWERMNFSKTSSQ